MRIAKLWFKTLIGSSLLLFLLGFAGTWGLEYWRTGRFEETTDNAYIRGDITSISPRVSGYVVQVHIRDNQAVKAGDILLRIDDRDYKARLSQADANIAAAKAALENNSAEAEFQKSAIAQAEAQTESALASQRLAQRNLGRIQELMLKQAASQAGLDQTEAAEEQADAAVLAAEAASEAQRRRLDVISAHRLSAEAQLAQARAAKELAQIDLRNTVLRAPVSGIIGNRQVRIGRYVTPGQALVDVVPVEDLWIVANFKETQLDNLRVGQSVRIVVDGYDNARIHGIIDSLAPGSGAAFSILPADNATGNFVRVVQRVPVKIRLTSNPIRGRLVPGLSARVAVRINSIEAR